MPRWPRWVVVAGRARGVAVAVAMGLGFGASLWSCQGAGARWARGQHWGWLGAHLRWVMGQVCTRSVGHVNTPCAQQGSNRPTAQCSCGKKVLKKFWKTVRHRRVGVSNRPCLGAPLQACCGGFEGVSPSAPRRGLVRPSRGEREPRGETHACSHHGQREACSRPASGHLVPDNRRGVALVVWWYSHGRGGLEGSSRLASTCRTVRRCAIQSAIGHVLTCLHPSAGAELAGVPQDCESWGRRSDGRCWPSRGG